MLPVLKLPNMKKDIKLLIKKLITFAGLKTKNNAANFLINLFNKNDIFSLPEKKQKIIIKNLLSYFDTLICGVESFKKRNIHFSENDIINHIENKTFDLKAIIKNVSLY